MASTRITSTILLGGEFLYLRAYDGHGLDTSSGPAQFAKPTAQVQIASGMAISSA